MRLFVAIVACLSIALSATASDGEDATITLRIADSFPTTHYIPQLGTLVYIKEVERLTKGQVKFQYFPAEQIGKAKDMLSLVLSGVTDIGFVGVGYTADKLPLSGVAELPGGSATSCRSLQAYWKLANGVLKTKEYDPLGVRVLFTLMPPAYNLYSRKRPIATLADLAGMKMRTGGGAIDLLAQKMKAVPVDISGPDMYEGLSRGTIDGAMLPVDAVVGRGLVPLLQYATVHQNFGTFDATFMISQKKFASLPPNVQKALVDAGETVNQSACAGMDRERDSMTEKLRAGGVKLVTWSSADAKTVRTYEDEVALEWAQGLDRRGLPGTEVLHDFQAALQQAK
jgi:TRAP-type C4-dicarboxylate transport system substrate-binding protein